MEMYLVEFLKSGKVADVSYRYRVLHLNIEVAKAYAEFQKSNYDVFDMHIYKVRVEKLEELEEVN